MMEKWFEIEIVAKNTRMEGLIFKDECYYITMRFKDEQVITHEVTFENYCSRKIGEKTTVKMYSIDGEKWSFSRSTYEPWS